MARTITVENVNKQNAFNILANEIEGHLIRLVSEWQDRKIHKVSGYGGLTAGFKAAVDAYCTDHKYNLPHTEDSSACRVWLNVYCKHGCIIASLRDLFSSLKTDIYLGRVDDTGVVTFVSGCTSRQTDYTVESVNGAFQRAYELESEARTLRSFVSDFG